MKLYIPKKINVGFQERSDTYTGKLAYIIYYDDKGVLRKQTSWNSWRDEKIPNVEFNNVPTEGFVLNKNVGGYKSDWNFRQSYIRVYDPRNFEFEITLENLLFLLSVGDCTRGKGLEGKFVYGWDKDKLVLLPCESEAYKISNDFTELSKTNIKTKDLFVGKSYIFKDMTVKTYIGRYMYYEHDVLCGSLRYSWKRKDQFLKVFVFHDGEKYHYEKDLKKISKIFSEDIHPNIAELVTGYLNLPQSSKIDHLFLHPSKSENPNNWAQKNDDGNYTIYTSYYKDAQNKKELSYIYGRYCLSLKEGILKAKYQGDRYYSKEVPYYYKESEYKKLPENTRMVLMARSENGNVYRVHGDL